MKWLGLICMMLLMVNAVAADNLQLDLYRETANQGKKFGNIEASPGETINAFVDAENLYDDVNDNRLELEDIDILVTIRDLDEGDDLEIELSEFDLRATKSREIPFSFEIPDRVEDRDYILEIEAEYDDQDVSLTSTETFTLTVQKTKHFLVFDTIRFDKNPVSCGASAELLISVQNAGLEDEDVQVEVSNDAQGYLVQRRFLIEAYPGVDSYALALPVTTAALPGNYRYEVSFIYGDLLRKDSVVLKAECGEEQIAEEDIAVETPPETIQITAPASRQTEKVTEGFSAPLLLFFGVLLVILVLTLVLILVLKR